jgi:hypothetical protein
MNTYGRNGIFDLAIWIKETECHGDLGRVGLMCAMRKSTAVVDRSSITWLVMIGWIMNGG